MIKFSENAVKRAVLRTAEAAFSAARKNCPVKTGRLKNSITVGMEGRTAKIYTDVEYAAEVELGAGRKRPKPYLSKGIAEAKKQAADIFRKELL